MEWYHNHYITVDTQNRVIQGFSDAFRQAREGDICIQSQGGYQFRLTLQGEENPALFTWEGVPLYKYENGEVLPRTEAEIAQDTAALSPPSPSREEQLQAQVAALESQLTDTQLALCSVYELVAGNGANVNAQVQ